jgi:purine-cytosine permease-like protein
MSGAIGLVPNFGEPIGEPLPAPGSEPAPSEEIVAQAAEPAAPPAAPEPFDTLLTGEQDGESPPGAPLPFGSGVARDDALDPFSRISGGSLGPVSVNTSGIAVIGGSIAPEPEPIVDVDRGSEPLTEMNTPTDDHPVAVVVPTPAAAPQPVFVPEAAGEESTPLDHRVGRAARLFWLWFASNSSIVAVVFGGIIFSLGMSLRQAIVATLAGVALSFIPLGLGTLAGKHSGQPTMVTSRATFGVVGNVVPAAIGLLSRLFWGAALLWLVGAGTASILTGVKASDGFSEQQLTFILMVIGFILVLVCAYYGYALIARVQLVVSILSGIFIVGFIALTSGHIDLTTALRTGDGSWVLAVTGAVLVFSFVGLVWANSSSDVARYQRPGSSGASSMLWATFGTALPSFVLIAYGALLAASDSKVSAGLLRDPLNELGHLLPGWYPVPLLAATALSLLSGAVLSIYSGGFALQSVGLRVPRRFATLVVGILVLVVALVLTISITNFAELFRDFSTTLAVPVAAWAGIFGAEIMIRNRRLDSGSLLRRGGRGCSLGQPRRPCGHRGDRARVYERDGRLAQLGRLPVHGVRRAAERRTRRKRSRGIRCPSARAGLPDRCGCSRRAKAGERRPTSRIDWGTCRPPSQKFSPSRKNCGQFPGRKTGTHPVSSLAISPQKLDVSTWLSTPYSTRWMRRFHSGPICWLPTIPSSCAA